MSDRLSGKRNLCSGFVVSTRYFDVKYVPSYILTLLNVTVPPAPVAVASAIVTN